MGLHRVARVDEIPEGAGREVVAAGRVIALFRIDGQVFAIDGVCAHAGGPVGSGVIDGFVVTCPWHGWQYDVRDGRHCLSPGICQQSFGVQVEDGDVLVEIPE